MKKISAVYKIKNMITGDFYIGSSIDVMTRWAHHKCPSVWNRFTNSPLYQDMQKYGLENFKFMIIAPAYPEHLKRMEQEFIEILKPTYNNYNAKGWNKERNKEWYKKWYKTEKCKEYYKKRDSQTCIYNGEELTLIALRLRLSRAGIPHPAVEAKKYLKVE